MIEAGFVLEIDITMDKCPDYNHCRNADHGHNCSYEAVRRLRPTLGVRYDPEMHGTEHYWPDAPGPEMLVRLQKEWAECPDFADTTYSKPVIVERGITPPIIEQLYKVLIEDHKDDPPAWFQKVIKLYKQIQHETPPDAHSQELICKLICCVDDAAQRLRKASHGVEIKR